MIAMLAKDFIISIHPRFATQILDSVKTVEIRSKVGNSILSGSKGFIYETAPKKMIVGYFVVDYVQSIRVADIDELTLASACIRRDELQRYVGNNDEKIIRLIHVLSPFKFNKPLPLEELYGSSRPPQSYAYIKYGLLHGRGFE